MLRGWGKTDSVRTYRCGTGDWSENLAEGLEQLFTIATAEGQFGPIVQLDKIVSMKNG